MYNLCESIRFANVLLQAFLTGCPAKIFEKLGIADKSLMTFDSIKTFGAKINGLKVAKGEALFKRIDIEKELKELDKIAQANQKAAQHKKEDKKKAEAASNQQADKHEALNQEDFAKIALRVGKVLAAEKVEKADKLLKLTVDLGEEKTRTIVSGIAKWYTPEDMVGKSIVVVSNLKPVKLRGILSEGMILCASDDNDNLSIVAPISEIKTGSEVR